MLRPLPLVGARRADNPRVINAEIRQHLVSNNLQQAKALFCTCPENFFAKSDQNYLQSLFCLREPDEIGWLAKTREALKEDPLHRDALTALASIELKLEVDLGSQPFLAHYLSQEPLDTSIRNLYLQILRRKDFLSEAREEEEEIWFLTL